MSRTPSTGIIDLTLDSPSPPLRPASALLPPLRLDLPPVQQQATAPPPAPPQTASSAGIPYVDLDPDEGDDASVPNAATGDPAQVKKEVEGDPKRLLPTILREMYGMIAEESDGVNLGSKSRTRNIVASSSSRSRRVHATQQHNAPPSTMDGARVESSKQSQMPGRSRHINMTQQHAAQLPTANGTAADSSTQCQARGGDVDPPSGAASRDSSNGVCVPPAAPIISPSSTSGAAAGGVQYVSSSSQPMEHQGDGSGSTLSSHPMIHTDSPMSSSARKAVVARPFPAASSPSNTSSSHPRRAQVSQRATSSAGGKEMRGGNGSGSVMSSRAAEIIASSLTGSASVVAADDIALSPFRQTTVTSTITSNNVAFSNNAPSPTQGSLSNTAQARSHSLASLMMQGNAQTANRNQIQEARAAGTGHTSGDFESRHHERQADEEEDSGSEAERMEVDEQDGDVVLPVVPDVVWQNIFGATSSAASKEIVKCCGAATTSDPQPEVPQEGIFQGASSSPALRPTDPTTNLRLIVEALPRAPDPGSPGSKTFHNLSEFDTPSTVLTSLPSSRESSPGISLSRTSSKRASNDLSTGPKKKTKHNITCSTTVSIQSQDAVKPAFTLPAGLVTLTTGSIIEQREELNAAEIKDFVVYLAAY